VILGREAENELTTDKWKRLVDTIRVISRDRAKVALPSIGFAKVALAGMARHQSAPLL
jgi:hypothetical protein